MKLIISLMFALSFVVAPSLAAAEDPREVEGRAAFSKGDYAHALDVFARLYAENGDPVYLRNIGRCHQKLRQPDEAIESFRSYLRRARKIKPAEKREVEGFIAEMETLQATMKNQAAAAEKAAADRAARNAERAPPAETPPARATTRVAPAETPPEKTEEPGLAPVSPIRRSKAPPDGEGAAEEPARTGSWHSPAALVGLGLTLVAAGVGTYGALRNRSLVADFDKSCAFDSSHPPTVVYSTKTGVSNAECQTKQGNYQSAAQLAIVGFVGAAVLGAASLVVWLTAPAARGGQDSKDRKEGKDGEVAMWSCAPGMTAAGGPSVGCQLRF